MEQREPAELVEFQAFLLKLSWFLIAEEMPSIFA
jgi:hypothetical protein